MVSIPCSRLPGQRDPHLAGILHTAVLLRSAYAYKRNFAWSYEWFTPYQEEKEIELWLTDPDAHVRIIASVGLGLTGESVKRVFRLLTEYEW